MLIPANGYMDIRCPCELTAFGSWPSRSCWVAKARATTFQSEMPAVPAVARRRPAARPARRVAAPRAEAPRPREPEVRPPAARQPAVARPWAAVQPEARRRLAVRARAAEAAAVATRAAMPAKAARQ